MKITIFESNFNKNGLFRRIPLCLIKKMNFYIFILYLLIIVSCKPISKFDNEFIERIPEFDGYNFQNKGLIYTWDKIDSKGLKYRVGLIENNEVGLKIDVGTDEFYKDFGIKSLKLNLRCVVLIQANDSIKIRACNTPFGSFLRTYSISEIDRNPLEYFKQRKNQLEELKIVEIYQSKDKDLIKYYVNENDIFVNLIVPKDSLSSKTKQDNKWILDAQDASVINQKWIYKKWK